LSPPTGLALTLEGVLVLALLVGWAIIAVAVVLFGGGRR